MPVPDSVYFGPTETNKSLHYGDVRALPEDDQFKALQRRFEMLFVGQVNELAKLEAGQRVVYAPFPLFLMTCVGIETSGKIFFSRAKRPGEKDKDVQREAFEKFCNRIDSGFSRPLTKQQKTDYDLLWGPEEHKKVKNTAHILYRFGRHTMVHGYRGKGVYITGENPMRGWVFENGAIILNPYLVWERFKLASDRLWTVFHKNREQNNPMRISARSYLSEILN